MRSLGGTTGKIKIIQEFKEKIFEFKEIEILRSNPSLAPHINLSILTITYLDQLKDRAHKITQFPRPAVAEINTLLSEIDQFEKHFAEAKELVTKIQFDLKNRGELKEKKGERKTEKTADQSEESIIVKKIQSLLSIDTHIFSLKEKQLLLNQTKDYFKKLVRHIVKRATAGDPIALCQYGMLCDPDSLVWHDLSKESVKDSTLKIGGIPIKIIEQIRQSKIMTASLADAYSFYRMAADRGDSNAQFILGIKLNNKEGFSYLDRAAKSGHPGALLYSGMFYYNDRDEDDVLPYIITRDYSLEYEYTNLTSKIGKSRYEAAAKRGEAAALFFLAEKYQQGSDLNYGSHKNPAKASELYAQFIQQTNHMELESYAPLFDLRERAAHYLAYSYLESATKSAPNYDEAIKYFRIYVEILHSRQASFNYFKTVWKKVKNIPRTTSTILYEGGLIYNHIYGLDLSKWSNQLQKLYKESPDIFFNLFSLDHNPSFALSCILNPPDFNKKYKDWIGSLIHTVFPKDKDVLSIIADYTSPVFETFEKEDRKSCDQYINNFITDIQNRTLQNSWPPLEEPYISSLLEKLKQARFDLKQTADSNQTRVAKKIGTEIYTFINALITKLNAAYSIENQNLLGSHLSLFSSVSSSTLSKPIRCVLSIIHQHVIDHLDEKGREFIHGIQFDYDKEMEKQENNPHENNRPS